MNRKYTRNDYLNKLKALKTSIPGCAVTTDIMVGFPGETDADFEDTMDLTARAEFSGAFTFVYSPRSGTRAAAMTNQVTEDVSKERIMRLIALQNSINDKSSLACVGKTAEVLCEDFDKKRGLWLGRDEYGKMVYFAGEGELLGKFLNIKITKASGLSLLGDIVGEVI